MFQRFFIQLVSYFAILLSVSCIFLSAAARPVDPSALDKANNYIRRELNQYGRSHFDVRITRGELENVPTPDGTEELVTGGSLNWSWGEVDGIPLGPGESLIDLTLYQDPKTQQSFVAGQASLSIRTSNPKDIFIEYAESIEDIIKMINGKGFYSLSLVHSVRDDGTVDATLELTPVSVDSALVKALKIKGVFPDRAESFFVLEAQGLFGLASDLVLNAQRSLTYVFSALTSEREPTDKEREGLGTLVNTILAGLAQIAE
jgi:hypothetical protein